MLKAFFATVVLSLIFLFDMPLVHGVLRKTDGKQLQVIGFCVTSVCEAVAGPGAVRAAVLHEVAAGHIQAVSPGSGGQLVVDLKRLTADFLAGLVDQVDQCLHIFRVFRVIAVPNGLLGRRSRQFFPHGDPYPEGWLCPQRDNLAFRILSHPIASVRAILCGRHEIDGNLHSGTEFGFRH